MTRTTSAPLVVAIDAGSSSVRAGLYDAGARRRGALAQVRYAPDVDGHGSVSVPVDRLRDALTETLDCLVADHAGHLPRVAAIGMSCFLHSVAGVDAAGRPVTPLLTWADTTAAGAAHDLRRRLDADELWQATGAPLHASYWPAKVMRLRELAGVAVRGFTGAPGVLWEALTGERGMDLSQASGTGLLDRASGSWHRPLLDALELGEDTLPPIVPRDASALLAGPAASRWPVLAGIPVLAPWSDAWCGNLGVGAVAGGPAALQVGTSGAMRVVLDEAVPRVPAGLFAHRLPDGTSLLGGQLSEGGGVAASVARLLGSSPRRLDALAAKLPLGGHGLTVLPYLSGERGPGYHAEARGVVDGLTLATTPEALYLATIEAIGVSFAALARRIAEQLGHQPDVVASGGAVAGSVLLPRVLAAALGRPIRLSSEPEASTRGAALRTLAAAGLITSPADVEAPRSTLVEPRPEWVDTLAAAAERQEALYRSVLGDA